MAEIELSSPAFSDRAPMPDPHAHQMQNLSPPLLWSGVPDDTAELTLMCEDPDAPSGTFLHWLVSGIDPSSVGVSAGEIPTAGSEHTNSFGERGWGGPEPPSGDPPHRYVFRLYALPEPIALPDRATAGEVHQALDSERFAEGTLIGLYQR